MRGIKQTGGYYRGGHYISRKQHIAKSSAKPKLAINLSRAALHKAAKNGAVATVRALIQEKADLNIQDSLGNTPMHLAAKNGRKEVVEALLAAKADPNAKNSSGETSLHVAVGHETVVQVLLQSEVDIRATDDHSHTTLDLAVQFNDWVTVKQLLEKSEALAGERAGRLSVTGSRSPDHLDDDEMLRLLQHRDGTNMFREPALHVATINGHETLLKQLLDASWATIDVQCTDKATAVHHAAAYGQIECLHVLINHKANLNVQDSSGRSAAHHAALKKHDKLLLTLLNRGADILIEDNQQKTVVDVLAEREQADQTAQLLLGLKRFDQSLLSALIIMARKGHENLLQAIFNQKPEFCTRHGTWKMDLWHEADLMGQENILDLLEKYKPRSGRSSLVPQKRRRRTGVSGDSGHGGTGGEESRAPSATRS